MKLIACVDMSWGIGCNGQLLARIPQDLQRFRELTMGHTVIMGRKTLESLPGGKPLKYRHNIVISLNTEYKVDGAEMLRDISKIPLIVPDDAFVVGGEGIYWLLLQYCDTAYITKIDAAFPADRYCPNLDERPDWTIVEESEPMQYNGLTYRYITYKRTRHGALEEKNEIQKPQDRRGV